MTAFLSCKRLTKRFGDLEVLKGIDLALEKGECLVLLGGSGCGKTTLLNVLAGLLPADSGRVCLNDRVLDEPATGTHVPARKRRFGMVFQDFSLWPNMTVAENIAFGLRVQGIGNGERKRRVNEALEQVRMTAFMDQLPSRLSGGQQQRVAIARALAVRPRVLLFDEPLSALDARLREELRNEIDRLIREYEMTAVYVTHDQIEAFSLADRVALMEGGHIVQIDQPEVLYNRPANRYVAEFLGAANLFEYQRTGASLALNGELSLPPPAGTVPDVGHLVVHREKVSITPSEKVNGAAGQVDLEGICRHQAYLGERCEVFAEAGSGAVFRGFSSERIPTGTSVRIRFAPEAMHFVST